MSEEAASAPTPSRSAQGGAAHAVPRDHDGWEPGVPPIRSILPSAVGGAIIPLAVYYLVRSHVGNDADGLAIAGIPAALWVCFQFVRRRRIDPIGAVVLTGFVLGLVVSFAMGGNAFVLKVRDSAFTFVFGLTAVVSGLSGRRPVTYFIGRALSAGSDPRRSAMFDQLWDIPPARAAFGFINYIWGVGLMLEATTRVVLAAKLSTKAFVAVSPAIGFAFIGSMGAATAWLAARSRHRAPMVDPEMIPPGGGNMWWWMRVYLGPAPDPAAGVQGTEG